MKRGQGGLTLIEVLLAMVVSTAIVVPLTAWVLMGFRQQSALRLTSQDDNSVNFVSAYLPRDVASASTVELGGADCSVPEPSPTTTASPTTTVGLPASLDSGGEAPAPRTVLLTLHYSGDDNVASRTVYVVDDEASGGTIIRRTCDVTGAPMSDTELASGLATPSGGWTAATRCDPAVPGPGETCRRVTMTMTGASGRRTSISAIRRTSTPLPTEPPS